MEFSRDLRAGVLSGDISVTFRLWRTPKVKAGGRYRLGPGQIEVDSIELIPFAAIDDADLRLTGDADRESLRRRVAHAGPVRDDTLVYRIDFHLVEHAFDQDYWERHWSQGRDGTPGSMADNPPNPYLARELGGLRPGTALDAGCGAGAEAIWLAAAGWDVTAADISREALGVAAERAAAHGLPDRIAWVEADLTSWAPGQPSTRYDLVTTHYAHPAMSQLDFYDRIGGWVAPGGTLLIVGHRHSPPPGPGPADDHGHGQGHGHGHAQPTPAEASVTAAAITARLDDSIWQVVTADEPTRTLRVADERQVTVDDVVVRAVRRQ